MLREGTSHRFYWFPGFIAILKTSPRKGLVKLSYKDGVSTHFSDECTMTTLLPHRWTVDDYHCIIASGILAEHRCELIRGEIIDIAPEGPGHAHRCETSARYLERLFGEGWWARQGKPITLSDSEPEPDIAVVKKRDYSQQHPYRF